MKKPLTLLRKEYIHNICEITNTSELPAFVIVDILGKVLAEMRDAADSELKRDEALYMQSLQQQEVKDDGAD